MRCEQFFDQHKTVFSLRLCIFVVVVVVIVVVVEDGEASDDDENGDGYDYNGNDIFFSV